MPTLLQQVPLVDVVTALLVIWVGYLATLAIYRLYLSPLARVPGPKLAALSNWYEFYYEVISNGGGQYNFKVEELHKKYGPIVRITPDEVHINDYTFFDTLFVKHNKSYKYEWLNGRFGTSDSVFTTHDPVHHRLRRAALNPMFSRRAISQQEPVVHGILTRLCDNLKEYKANDRPLALQKMFSALTCDAIAEYMFGFNYNQIDAQDFNTSFHQVFLEAGNFGNVGLFFPWFGKAMKSLPDNLVIKLNPSVGGLVRFTADIFTTVSRIIKEDKQGVKPEKRTIIHEVMDSSLPPVEKKPHRISEEAMTIVGAGLVTTAWALTCAVYYLLEDPSRLEKLRHELLSAIPDVSAPDAFSFKNLEPLPYLNACLREGIRLSHGVSARIPRLFDVPITYGEYTIPHQTPISMTISDIHFNEDLYPNAHQFIPERWLNQPKAPDGESLEKYWVAFGKGHRNCLGINMAWLEVTLALATFIRKFECELYETDIFDIALKHDFFVPSPKLDTKGVRVKITRIEE